MATIIELDNQLMNDRGMTNRPDNTPKIPTPIDLGETPIRLPRVLGRNDIDEPNRAGQVTLVGGDPVRR